jgi:hypothetical protein
LIHSVCERRGEIDRKRRNETLHHHQGLSEPDKSSIRPKRRRQERNKGDENEHVNISETLLMMTRDGDINETLRATNVSKYLSGAELRVGAHHHLQSVADIETTTNANQFQVLEMEAAAHARERYRRDLA